MIEYLVTVEFGEKFHCLIHWRVASGNAKTVVIRVQVLVW